jgi:PST family polysaccharide transporter
MGVIDKIKGYIAKDIVKVFSLNAVGTLVKMVSNFISVKVIAYTVGPSGVALLGQLQNFVQLALGYSNGGIHNGITKYVAEYKNDETKLKPILSCSLKLTLFFTTLSSIIMIVFHDYLSSLIMQSHEYGYLFIIFGVTIFMYTLNLLLISILNGFKEFRKYVIINIAGSVFSLILIVSLVFICGIHGALIGAVTYQSLSFIVTLLLCRRLYWLKRSFFNQKVDFITIKKFLRFSAMSLVSVSLVPICQMVLRGYVISNISAVEAGWWEGMNRISGMYLMIITTSFSVYYLPRLSEIYDPKELKSEIIKCYQFLVPLLLGILLLTYFFRILIIRILFSEEFLPMENLFIWQLCGDYFKVISWVLAYLMLAKAMTRRFILTEVVFTILLTLLSFLFLSFNSVIGLTQGYCITYIVYSIVMFLLFKNILLAK